MMKKLIAVFFCVALVLTLAGCGSNKPSSSDIPASSEPEPLPDPITVSVASTGDMLIHTPLITSYRQSDGEYDFNDIFKCVYGTYDEYDYVVANLEVTFGGSAAGAYCGTGTTFNCPDSFSDALRGAGVDMLLTANNHSYDTGSEGLRRTRDVLKSKGMAYTGSYFEDDKPYIVADVGGIKIGMVNYSYQTGNLTEYSLNNRVLRNGDEKHINTFSVNYLDAFYAEMESRIAAMRADGAEAIMLYIHWGDEYHQEPNPAQQTIAQKMCDLGVDVIVGGHPHVLEPMDVLTSSVNGKQTFVIYSTGNAVSNQRISEMTNTGKSFPCVANGASEDGVIFVTEFTKYGDGRVEVSAIDAVPTWVNLYTDGTGRHFQIVPLPSGADIGGLYNLSATGAVDAATRSRKRTSDLLAAGLEKCRSALKK